MSVSLKQQPPHCFCCHNTHTGGSKLHNAPQTHQTATEEDAKGLSPHLGLGLPQTPTVTFLSFLSFLLPPWENPPCLTCFRADHSVCPGGENEQQLGPGKRESTTHAHTHIHPFQKINAKFTFWMHYSGILHFQMRNSRWRCKSVYNQVCLSFPSCFSGMIKNKLYCF